MSRVLAEPPAKRQRARDEGGESADGAGAADEDQEFQRLERVSAVQDELNVLSEEEAHQVLLVHKAFLKRKRPLFARRQEAIAQVPDFWLKVLLAHPLTQPYISDGDQLALSYLEAVAVHKALSPSAKAAEAQAAAAAAASAAVAGNQAQQNGAAEALDKESAAKSVADGRGGRAAAAAAAEELEDDDGVGFRVTFTFRENPFFSNAELWREWEPTEGQAAYSSIDWKNTEESKELQSFLLWNLDPESEEDETPTFFSIFSEHIEDYELGEALRGDITDNPLDIYMRHTFEADADEEGEEEEEEDVGEGEEEEEEVYDEEDGDEDRSGVEAGVDGRVGSGPEGGDDELTQEPVQQDGAEGGGGKGD